MKLTFKQFESALRLLEEKAPLDVTEQELIENGLTEDDLCSVNEGIIGDLFGGIFKKFKEKINRMIPGSVMKKADVILKKYQDMQEGVYGKIKNERNKIFKASSEVEADLGNKVVQKRYDEIKERSDKAIKAIEDANKSRNEAINQQLVVLSRDQNQTVRDYIDLKVAEIQEQIAVRQLKDAEEFASEKDLKKIEEDVRKAKEHKEEAAKALEASLKEGDNKDKKKQTVKKNVDKKI